MDLTERERQIRKRIFGAVIILFVISGCVMWYGLWYQPHISEGAGSVTYDNSASSNCDTNSGNCTVGNTQMSYPLTVGSGSNRQLAVIVTVAGNSGEAEPAVSTVKYAGVDLTKQVHVGTNYYTELWTMPAGIQPTSGANNVVITLASNLTSVQGPGSIESGAISVAGADQTTVLSASNSNSGSGTAASVTLGASGSGDLVISGVCNGTSVGSTPQTSRYTTPVNGGNACGTAGGATAAGNTTNLSYTVGNDSWQMVAAAFKAAAASAGNPAIKIRGGGSPGVTNINIRGGGGGSVNFR